METIIGLAQRKSVANESAASTVTLYLNTSEWTDIATLTVPQGGDAGAYATLLRSFPLAHFHDPSSSLS